MFVDAVADQSLVIQGYLNSVACTKSFLHYIFPPRPGATFNFIKKLVKVTLSLCLSPACLSVWTCFFSKALWGLCSCSSTSACLAIGAVPGDRRAAILQRDSRDTGIWLEGHSLLWTGHWVNAGGAKGKKNLKNTKKPLRSGSYSSVSTTDTQRHTPQETQTWGHWKTPRGTHGPEDTPRPCQACTDTHTGDGDQETLTHGYVRQLQPAPLSNRRQLSFLCLP